MQKLQQAVTQLTENTPHFQINNPVISQASVGWHIAHSYLVINGIVAALKNSNPSNYRYSFNFSRVFVMLTGGFPRGKGKAPEQVMPRAEINPEFLAQLAAKTNIALADLPDLPKDANFKHPYFGLLNKKSTIRILEIHTQHHHKIIKEMLA